jgi:hypothetical protein
MPTFKELATCTDRSRIGDAERLKALLISSFELVRTRLHSAVSFVVFYSKVSTPAFWTFASVALYLRAQKRPFDGWENGKRIAEIIVDKYATLPPNVDDILNEHAYKLQSSRKSSEAWRNCPATQMIEICHTLTVNIHGAHKQRSLLLVPQYDLLTVSFLIHISRLRSCT